MKVFDEKPAVYLITKGDLTAENFLEKSPETLAVIERAAAAEISLIQIREKSITARQVFELASKAARIIKNSKTKLLVNDRADIARAAGADGVHLPAKSLPAEAIRAGFGADFIVGVSAHSLEEVAKAKLARADFATFSPIFATASKAEYGPPQGIAKLREVAETLHDFPVIALGGIDADNFANVLKAGAKGVAAIRSLNDAENLAEIAERIFSFRDD